MAYAKTLANLNSQPETVARDELIKQLTDSLKQLTSATNDNTSAIQAQLDPLMSQGHSYLDQLKIGYYHAASGMDATVQGNGGTDSVPVHMMLTPGERLQVTPPGGRTTIANDNKKVVTQYITFNLQGDNSSSAPLSVRQRAQGYIAAAARAAG